MHGAPVCGRPFLGRQGRTHRKRAEWWLVTKPRVSALASAERAAIAEHYRAAALMEHASIAAFARFTLELMTLGAPAELVSASVSAMADETAHTQLCTALANRYADTAFSPGALDVTGALSEPELLSVVDRAVIEGILGETSAALEAAGPAMQPNTKTVRYRPHDDRRRREPPRRRSPYLHRLGGEARRARAPARGTPL